ncbi:MAG: flagellar motor protein MotB [Sedimentitalea sp.]
MSASTNVAPVIIKRKKVSGGDGHHGGAWKVAYADFVTAMMAFFMLMWLLNATTEKQRKGLADYFSPTIPIHKISGGSDGPFGGTSQLSEEILAQIQQGASEKHPTESMQSRGDAGVDDSGGADSSSEFEAVQEALKGKAGESEVSDDLLKHIVTKVTDEGMVIELFDTRDDKLFEGETNEPTDLLRALTKFVGQASALVPNGVAVGGHLRANPVVALENPVWELSTARAKATRLLLQGEAVEPERFQRIVGHGDRDHVDENPMAERNNRIEIILLNED